MATAATATVPPQSFRPKRVSNEHGQTKNTYQDAQMAEIQILVETFIQDPSVLAILDQIAKPQVPKTQLSEEATQAVHRILNCSSDSYADILEIPQDASKAKAREAWRRLGCLLQPYTDKKIGDAKAKAAFSRLTVAAYRLGVNWIQIGLITWWDNQEPIKDADLAEWDDEEVATDGKPTEYEIPEPPIDVREIYDEATEWLCKLALNPNDEESLKRIEKLNLTIDERNSKEGHDRGLWTISIRFFIPQYKMALEHYDTIRDNPSDATATTHIDTLKEVIDKVIQLNHYPKAWSIPTRKKYLEAKVAIERIMECGETSPNEEILGVAPDATKQDKLAAWRTLGCLIHPDYAKQRNAEAAFERLKDAAEKDVDEDDIAHVVNWDGEDDLSEDTFTEENPNVPEPPERVTRIYKNATPSLRTLFVDPYDGMVVSEIEGFNEDIRDGNLREGVEQDTWAIPVYFFVPHYRYASEAYKTLNEDPTNEKATQDLTQLKAVIDGKIQRDYLPKEWTINTAEDHIKKGLLSKETKEKAERASEAAENAKTLFQKFEEQRAAADEATKADLESTEETAKAAVASAEAAAEKAKAEAARTCWSYAAAAAAFETANGECTKAREAEGAVNDALSKAVAAVEAAKNNTKAKAGRIEYPWTTMKIDDRERIVGYRMIGKFGRQVCVETEEDDGRVIRRLESASDVGLPEVQQYIKMTGHKNLAEDQSTWSTEDRGDFEELLYVTTSQIKRKNTAANGKNPNAYCCVRFTKKGINMLTVGSLGRVLGPISANRQIKMACKRDGILPPWDAGWASHYHDEAKVEQDPEKARAKRDDQAKANSRDRSARRGRGQRSDEAPQRAPSPLSEAEASDLRSKVDKLESKVDDMAAKMSKLDDMNKKMEELAAMLISFVGGRRSTQ